MALFKSQVLTQASGSVGGMTYSHNAGGMYIRSRAIPTNPNTGPQNTARSVMGTLANEWTNTLTEPQRIGWRTYAQNVPLINPLGDPITVSGLNMYIRSNSPRLQATGTRIDDAPTTFNLGDPPTCNPVLTAPTSISLTFDTGQAWVNQDDGYLLAYISRPVSTGIQFFRGPYLFTGRVDGDSVTPPTSPAALTAAYTFAAGQAYFMRFQISQNDGRLSQDIFVGPRYAV